MVRKFFGTLIFVAALWATPAWSESPASSIRWQELSHEQQNILSPLSKEWDDLRPWQREKMLDIARDYPRMNQQEQARVKQRLDNWSRMTPYQRENARKKYQQFQSLPTEKQDALRQQWREYQRLSEPQREKLRNAPPQPTPEDDLGE